MCWHTRTPNRSTRPRRIIWIVYKRASEPLPGRYHSIPQDDGHGWGEAQIRWRGYLASLPPGDRKRRLLCFDMPDGLSLDWKKRDGKWVQDGTPARL